MARPLRIQYPDAHYHVTCRGVERRKIFIDEEDYSAFLEKLSRSLSIYNVVLYAFIVMSNHFHLLIKTLEGNLSEFMRHFNICYTGFFNRRHRRVGNLYQGRYKAFLIDADNYLMEVSRYIHLNPIRVKSNKKKSVEEKIKILLNYKRSSLPGYLWRRKREGFVNYSDMLDYFSGDIKRGRQSYKEFVFRGIEGKTGSCLALGSGHGIVGDENFITWVKERFLGEEIDQREKPAVRELRKRHTPQRIIAQYLQIVKKPKEQVCRKGKQSIERVMLMELLYRVCKITQPEIGILMGGLDYSSVSNARRRLLLKIAADHQLAKRFEELLEHFSEM